MRYLYILAVLAIACNHAGQPTAKDSTTAQPVVFAPKEPAKIILEMYEELPPFDTLDLGGGPESTEGRVTGMYEGKPLGMLYFPLLPGSLTDGLVPDGTNELEYFACHRFPINNRFTGLITRTPGEYDITRVSLLYYDHEADSIGYAFDVINNWGDAGDAINYRTWLIRAANSVECWMAIQAFYDGEDLEDSLYETSTDYFKVDLATRMLDTSYKNKPEWAPVFRRLLGENYEEPDSIYVNTHTNSN